MIHDRYIKYIFVPLTAFVIVYVLTPLVCRLARRYGWMDEPGGRRMHDHPAPRGGGLAVWIGFHVGCAAIFFMPWGTFGTRLEPGWGKHFLLISGLILVLGLIDDRWPIRPWLKLAGQTGVAVLAFALGFRAESLLGVDLHPVADFLFTTLWIVGAMNAFNLIDGMDGVASGLAIVAALAMAGQSLLQGFPGDALVALALIGACAAFLRYNFHPASIFLGDSGSMFIGLTIAVLALKTSAEAATLTALLVPILAVGVPAFDALLAIWRRSVRQVASEDDQGGVFSADTDHLHHRLRRTGISQKQVAVLLYALAAALVAVGFVAFFFQGWARSLYFLTFLGSLYLVVRHLAKVELWETGMAILKGLHRPQRQVVSTLLYPVADLSLLVLTAGLLWSFTHDRWLFARVGAGAVPFLGLWLALPFVLLVLTRTYQRVWSLARPSEYVFLGLALAAGGGLAAVTTNWPHDMPMSPWNHWLVFMAICGVGMIGIRAFPRLLRDVMSQFQWAYDTRHRGIRNVLLYGDGAQVALYLRSQSTTSSRDEKCERIMGVLSEDTNLHGRRICGYPVFGDLDHLPRAARKYPLQRIVILQEIPSEKARKIKLATETYGLETCQWRSGLAPLPVFI